MADDEKAGSWFREQYERAKALNAEIPPHARMVVTDPALSDHRRTPDTEKDSCHSCERLGHRCSNHRSSLPPAEPPCPHGHRSPTNCGLCAGVDG